jgi:hypothetical protein
MLDHHTAQTIKHGKSIPFRAQQPPFQGKIHAAFSSDDARCSTISQRFLLLTRERGIISCALNTNQSGASQTI